MTTPTVNMQKTFAVGMFVLLIVLFGLMVAGFLGALVFAGASALLFYPLQKRLEGYMRPQFAAGINLVLFLFLIIVPAVFLMGLATTQALGVAEQATGWINDRLTRSIELPEWVPYGGEFEDLRDEVTGRAGEVAGAVGRFLVRALSQVTQATGLFLLDLFVASYFFFYCLISGQNFVRMVVTSLPLNDRGRQELVRVSAGVTESVLRSMVVIGAVQAVFSGLAFWVADIRGFVFWGIVMGFLSVIPFIGPVIIWLPVAVYLALSGDYWSAVAMAVWFWVVVASVDNVLRPIMVGADTKMPEVLVLLTTLGGLFFFGAIGLLVGPLIGALLMASWAVYREAFADELGLTGHEDSPAAETGDT